jgi:hypothetical protein
MEMIPMRSKDPVRALAASLLLVCTAPTLAAAEVRFSGNIDQFVLEAKNATLSEIVSGMRSALKCKIILRGSTNQQFTGTYSGSLRRVLAHLLKDANYVVSPDRDQISIVLIAADGARDGTRIAQPGSVDEPAPDVQGWNGRPSELPAPARPTAGTSVTAAGDPEPANSSHVQGWTGRPSELPAPSRQAGGAIVTAALDSEPANSSDVQGWTGRPSELPALARPVASASVAAAVDSEPSNSSDVQGWTGEPSELPPRAISH